ncbi:MAG TPA: hypothetical protein V6C76_15250 [Drouetiella sp.]
MPDWSYNTIFQPALFKLPAATARDTVFGMLSGVAALPFGRQIFQYMGHEAPEPVIECNLNGLQFPTPISCGAGFKLPGKMLRVFDTFTFGMIELGPVTRSATVPNDILQRQSNELSIIDKDGPDAIGLDLFIQSLPQKSPAVPVFIRIAFSEYTKVADAKTQVADIVSALPTWVNGVTLDTRWIEQFVEDLQTEQISFLQETREILAQRNLKSLLLITPDLSSNGLTTLVSAAIKATFDGITLGGGVRRDNVRHYGASTKNQSITVLKQIREIAPDIFVIASGGIIEPADAVDYFKAGASMVQLYSGLVYSGPGMPKRIEELCCHMLDVTPDAFPRLKKRARSAALQNLPASYSSPYTFKSVLKAGGWLGFACMGAGLLITCSSAITVGLTSVILPYDEHFLGITRDTMQHFNSNLLPFMSHDRVTYAGSSVSCGLLFLALSAFGSRIGERWAYQACLYASSFGVFSFLLFLGFHYLDPLHMFVTMLLLPFWAWGAFAKPKFTSMRSSNTHNTEAWRNSLFGQLLFVEIGIGLFLAGCTICYVGTHTVFVAEDLMFMHTTANELLSHNAHLLPAIAHDRAGFGATLVTAGIAVLGTAVQGFRQGEGWVWWMLFIGGLPGFAFTLGIHMHIGYTSFVHLLPAYIASAMFVSGLALSYKYLCVEPGV